LSTALYHRTVDEALLLAAFATFNGLLQEAQGKEVPDADMLRNEVANTPVGEEVKMTVFRKGQKQDPTVKIGSQEEENKAVAASLKAHLSVAVRPLTVKEIDSYGLGVRSGSRDQLDRAKRTAWSGRLGSGRSGPQG